MWHILCDKKKDAVAAFFTVALIAGFTFKAIGSENSVSWISWCMESNVYLPSVNGGRSTFEQRTTYSRKHSSVFVKELLELYVQWAMSKESN
jgi:hypothetical protein